MPSVTFTIKKDGRVISDANGFTGGECVKAVESIVNKMGGQAAVPEYKPEYHAEPPETVTEVA